MVCGDGLDCVAGESLEITPGYHSLPITGVLLASGDKSYKIEDIFFCPDATPCPGGEPGTCATGHDATSISSTDDDASGITTLPYSTLEQVSFTNAPRCALTLILP